MWAAHSAIDALRRRFEVPLGVAHMLDGIEKKGARPFQGGEKRIASGIRDGLGRKRRTSGGSQ
jgi:hypothetical protein